MRYRGDRIPIARSRRAGAETIQARAFPQQGRDRHEKYRPRKASERKKGANRAATSPDAVPEPT